jgi:hypothetical protein
MKFARIKNRACRNIKATGDAKSLFCEGPAMDESKLADELNELVKQFGGTTDPTSKRLILLAKEAENKEEQLQKSVDCLRESIDYLRVCIKYLMLDIEATRRENEYLRKLLQEKGEEE